MVRPTKYDDLAPNGTVWWCPQCGRISADRHGKLSMLGWTDHCSLLALLVSESSMQVDSKGRITKAEPVPNQPEPLPGSELAREMHV